MKKSIRPALLTLIGFFLMNLHLSAQTSLQNKISGLTDDTQKTINTDEEFALIWWIPSEFWLYSFQAEGGDDPMVKAMADDMMGYTMVAVIYADRKGYTGFDFRGYETVSQSIRVVDAQGKKYKPIGEEETNTTIQFMISMMKPVLTNMMGDMGENCHFFVFENTNEKGLRIDDPLDKGSFTVELFEESHVYRRPLGSLAPAKTCPVDNEQMNGAWEYCPWHGNKLN